MRPSEDGFPPIDSRQICRDEHGVVLGLESGHQLAPATQAQDDEFGLGLRMGDWLDCVDSELKWRLSQVVAEHPEQILVHFHGWSTKWDEWISRVGTRRIKPWVFTQTCGDGLVISLGCPAAVTVAWRFDCSISNHRFVDVFFLCLNVLECCSSCHDLMF